MITSGVDGTARVWYPQSPLLRRGGGPVWEFASDPAGTHWFAANSDHRIMLWRVDGTRFTRMPDPVVPSGVALAESVAITPDGVRMAAGTRSGKMVSWMLGSAGAGQPHVDQLLPEGTRLLSITFDSSSTVVAVTAPHSTVTAIARLSPTGTWQPESTIHTPTPMFAVFDLSRPVLYVGVAADTVTVWDVHDPAHPVEDSSSTE